MCFCVEGLITQNYIILKAKNLGIEIYAQREYLCLFQMI